MVYLLLLLREIQGKCPIRFRLAMVAFPLFLLFSTNALAQLKAGVAKTDITNRDAGLVNDPLYAKALILDDGRNKMVIITLDVVAIEEIGPIRNGYLSEVRSRIEKELGIPPENVLINSSHCHGMVRDDVAALTVEAVLEANKKMVPVHVGAGAGYEERISENRRVWLKDGTQVDMRRAYAFPPDEQIKKIGPIDPEIGLMRLNKEDGQTLAVLYNFAVHPIQGVPNGGNTADMIGFASKVIEENLPGAMALFLQGCGGDINPISYKKPDVPPDAEPLGNILGFSVLRALEKIETKPVDRIEIINERMDLPRADFSARIDSMEARRLKLVQSFRGTNINLKAFHSLLNRHSYSPDFPSAPAYRYMHDITTGNPGLERLDKINENEIEKYRNNIYIMEELTRVNENLGLIKKHHAAAAGRKTVDVEILGMKIGDFHLVTFPGELTVQIGLNIKDNAEQEFTFVAGYTNGYIYYAPTAEQLRNTGAAQEDSETILAPEWQDMFEQKAAEILARLAAE